MPKTKGFFTASLIFADIKGFTQLSKDAQLIEFYETLYPELCNKVKTFQPTYVNSWGDALFCVFEDPIAAADCALAIRDLFAAYNWTDTQLPKMQVRVSLHSGRAYRGKDPITGEAGYIGTQINLAARIEPIVKPGEVWTTDKFVSLLNTANPEHLDTDNLGVKPLAKKWGGQEIHRLRRKNESPLEDDNIYEKVETVSVDTVATILALYDRGDDNQKLKAIDMMGKRDDPRIMEKLTSIVLNGSLPITHRLMAIAGMGEIKNSKALSALESVLNSKDKEDPRITRASIKAIASIGDLRSGKIVQNVLEHREEYPEYAVLQAIEALVFIPYQPAIKFAAELLEDESLDFSIAERILAMLTLVGDERCIPAVRPFLDRSRPVNERIGAIVLIVRHNPLIIKEELISIARDTNEPEGIRGPAFAGLAKIDTTETKSILAEISERAEPISSLALQYLVEGKERAEKQERSARNGVKDLIW
jgi:class 3 adenylate cyclase